MIPTLEQMKPCCSIAEARAPHDRPVEIYTFRMKDGKERLCPAPLWEVMLGPKPPHDWAGCDGCTASPDSIGGKLLWPACRIHDYHYDGEPPDLPRALADLTFRINLWRILRAQGASRWDSIAVAGAYFAGVTLGGRRHYRRKDRGLR